MTPLTKREEFILDSPIGEPDIVWREPQYIIERVVKEDGTIVWFGQGTNWVYDKQWTKLAEDSTVKPLEEYLPDIVYPGERNIFVPCEEPIYETLYKQLA
jgi:hypothetical protein